MIRTIAFVDFDGTITMEDTFSGAMHLFVDPDEFSLYSKKLTAGAATLSEVVRKVYPAFPNTSASVSSAR